LEKVSKRIYFKMLSMYEAMTRVDGILLADQQNFISISLLLYYFYTNEQVKRRQQ